MINVKPITQAVHQLQMGQLVKNTKQHANNMQELLQVVQRLDLQNATYITVILVLPYQMLQQIVLK